MMLLRTHCGLALGLVALVSCDKLPAREHLDPLDQSGTSGPGSQDGEQQDMDEDGSGGFKPPPAADAGSFDGGNPDADDPLCGQRPTSNVAFSKQALLESIARCTIAQYCEFEGLASKFADKAAAYAAAPSDQTLLDAQTAWYFANQQWQVAELFRFGPAAAGMEPGGQGLRDEIYAFPNSSRCALEEQLVSQGYSDKFSSIGVNARGLGAAEYLLFFEGTNNACSKFNSLNYPAPGSWAALSAEELGKRKQAYAKAVAGDILEKARALLAAWDPQQGNFQDSFVKAGRGSEVFASEQAALNAVSNALFYMEKEVRDWKVMRPAGLYECGTACAGYAESLYAKVGSDNVRANLKGLRLLFQGCGANHEGLGFDDWLRAVDMESVAVEMLTAIDDAEAAMANLDLDAAFTEDPSRVTPVRDALSVITDILKTDLMSALNLERPMALEGDND